MASNQAEFDNVIAGEKVFSKIRNAHLAIDNLASTLKTARMTMASILMQAKSAVARAIKDADDALLLMAHPPNPSASVDQILKLINKGAKEMNITEVCIKQAVKIINEEEMKVNTMLRRAAAAGGDARATVQRAVDKLMGNELIALRNEDIQIQMLYMWRNAVSAAWLIVHESNEPNITGMIKRVKNDLEHTAVWATAAAAGAAGAGAALEQITIDNIDTSHKELIYDTANMVKNVGADIISYMTIVINEIDTALRGLQSVTGKAREAAKAAATEERAVEARAAARASVAGAAAEAAAAAAVRVGAVAAEFARSAARATTEADVTMMDVAATMPNTDEEYAWVVNKNNYNKRQRTRGGKRKSKKPKRSRRGKKQIKKTKKYKKRSNKK